MTTDGWFNESGAEVLRRSGGAWTMSFAGSTGRFGALVAVDATSASDAWAVGTWTDGDGIGHGLTLHWDGHGWDSVPIDDAAPFDAVVGDVEILAADDVWAVGNPLYDRGSPFVLHWDGHAWSRRTLPAGAAGVRLVGVAARAADDVVIVGDKGSVPYLLHWNGSTWRTARSPSAGRIAGVSSGGGAVWAAGTRPGGKAWRTLLLRWDGVRWRTVWTPNATDRGNGLSAVGVASDGSIVAVGSAARRRGTLPLVLTRC
jgi:hypothetical protein